MLSLGNILTWVQVASAVLVVAAILMQRSDEGLGSAFGGAGSGGVTYAKRGLEKTLFIATIVLAIIFVVTSLLNLLF